MKLIWNIFKFFFKVIIGIIIGVLIVVAGIALLPYIAAAAAFIGGMGLLGWLAVIIIAGEVVKPAEEK